MSMHVLTAPCVLCIRPSHQGCASIDTGDIMRQLMHYDRWNDFAQANDHRRKRLEIIQGEIGRFFVTKC